MSNSDKKTGEDFKAGHATHSAVRAKKLESLLVLLYRAFLNGETDLPAEIKAALLRRVTFSQEFALKIRMVQADFLDIGRQHVIGEWDSEHDLLFPQEDPIRNVNLDKGSLETLEAYKTMVLRLL